MNLRKSILSLAAVAVLSTFVGCGGLGKWTIAVAKGSSQSALVGQAFGLPLSVVVMAGNNPLQGEPVTFSAPASGASGTFAGSSTETVS
ncbi:MAG TPA: hypothetical protein VGR96_04310, partial [Acidobacteriaceae bacterium]|nr:hypothetical protein [Acidobacteriaceae bacterium]